MGEVLGRLLSTAQGVNYWDSPLKVPSFRPIFQCANFPTSLLNFVFFGPSFVGRSQKFASKNLVHFTASGKLYHRWSKMVVVERFADPRLLESLFLCQLRFLAVFQVAQIASKAKYI